MAALSELDVREIDVLEIDVLEIDVREIEGLAGKAMKVALARMSIHLDERRSNDLHEYLVDLGYTMAKEYDPAVGQAFSTWFYRRARQRVVDWMRSTHGDSRRGHALEKLAVTYPATSLNRIGNASPDARFLGTEDPERDSLTDAIVELGRDLSPSAQWTLVNVAGRVAEGAKISQAALEAGLTTQRANRQLEELREELRESPQSPQTSRNGSAQVSGAMTVNDGAEPLPATSGHRPPLL